MRELQRITISGTNWNDIVGLPCFPELSHYEGWSLVVAASYEDGKPVGNEAVWYGSVARVGDTLVEYDDGEWGVAKGKGDKDLGQ